jgi:hypothetical protein
MKTIYEDNRESKHLINQIFPVERVVMMMLLSSIFGLSDEK